MTQFAGALGHMNTRSDRFRNSDCRNSCSLGRIQGWVGVGQLHTYLLSTGNDRQWRIICTYHSQYVLLYDVD